MSVNLTKGRENDATEIYRILAVLEHKSIWMRNSNYWKNKGIRRGEKSDRHVFTKSFS